MPCSGIGMSWLGIAMPQPGIIMPWGGCGGCGGRGATGATGGVGATWGAASGDGCANANPPSADTNRAVFRIVSFIFAFLCFELLAGAGVAGGRVPLDQLFERLHC